MKNNNKKAVFIVSLIMTTAFFSAVGLIAYYKNKPVNQKKISTGGSSFIEAKEDGNINSFKREVSSIEDVANKLSPSVVSIVGSKDSSSRFLGFGSSNAGTGIVVTDDGYIITNKHVVDGNDKISVIMHDGEVYDGAKIAAKDPLNDVAFIKVDISKKLIPAELGDSKTIRIGQDVVAIGNALGQYQNTVTSGIVSGLNRDVEATDGLGKSEALSDMIQTDAAINSGNSGGPLVNAKGQVIGINTAVAEGNGIGFAIPISSTKGMLKSLIAEGEAKRAVIGVNYISLNPAISQKEGLKVSKGAYIKSNSHFSKKMEKVGLKNGDIVTEVNGNKIGVHGSLSSLISEFSHGEEVELTIIRDDSTIKKRVRLSAYDSL